MGEEKNPESPMKRMKTRLKAERNLDIDSGERMFGAGGLQVEGAGRLLE